MKSKEVYLIFSNTGTFLSRCIKFYSRDPYVHISLSFDDSFKKMYSFGRIFPNNPFIGGFVVENLYDGVYKKFRKSTCLIYKIYIDDTEFILLKREVEKFLKDQKKYRYNIIGLFGVVINRPMSLKNSYFCSEFISYLLIKSNIYKTDKKPGLIKPSDLLNIELKEFIYEGLACEYNGDIYNAI
ncbi:hypothetical protein NSA50_09540 [Clostridium sp. DSM 100503]|uniref:hypothetical protein n=1 Tax=Clostridium sp. DSM 100503 TaxID=2963282 RepID=UPI002149DE7C|nr:hypothetical protein [Clostridium sp. DSM 100503]MCR1951291.1 hypothetical protein [Clostridium sp. DSM 100503]